MVICNRILELLVFSAGSLCIESFSPSSYTVRNFATKQLWQSNNDVHNNRLKDTTAASATVLYASDSSSPDEIISNMDGEESTENGVEILAEEVNGKDEVSEEEEEEEEELSEGAKRDHEFMTEAIKLASSTGGERGSKSPFPRPIGAALLVAKDGTILGEGYSTYDEDCVPKAIRAAGLKVSPLREWCVNWPSDQAVREAIAESTLYLTLEPSAERRGSELPPITQLIEYAGIPRVVIGSPDPVEQMTSKGATQLHSSGLVVTMGVKQEECDDLIPLYSNLANSKLHRMARRQLEVKKRPLGFLHCSVIDSQDAKAFARNGNAFGKGFGGFQTVIRDFGTYEIAPPPELIWASPAEEEDNFDWETERSAWFEEEEEEVDLSSNPMMPWYEQCDAIVCTFPREGNGPSDDQSVTARLKGLKWLATQGKRLPPAVERILVMDAKDLASLPIENDDPNLPPGVDVEEFWKGEDRKPTRVLLRHRSNAMATTAANAAAAAAQAALEAALKAQEALESGDAEAAAEAAIASQKAAMTQAKYLQEEMQTMQDLKSRLTSLGVVVESLRGGDPIDVMNHLGERSGHQSVVWRAGCWGDRGSQSILKGAFQWVSAHLAVDAVGGKFWQLMLAERCVQGACGPEQKVKVFSEDEDISLEYCDDESADSDCVLTVDGRPIRHVRLDCRVALVDSDRKREIKPVPVRKFKKEEDAPWFL